MMCMCVRKRENFVCETERKVLCVWQGEILYFCLCFFVSLCVCVSLRERERERKREKERERERKSEKERERDTGIEYTASEDVVELVFD